jgi:hypothetical protein
MPSCLVASLASCTETSDLSHILMWDKQACMETTVIVTRFCKHVQYDFSFPDIKIAVRFEGTRLISLLGLR